MSGTGMAQVKNRSDLTGKQKNVVLDATIQI